MRTERAARILADEMGQLQRHWEAATSDESKALATAALLMVIPDGLETLRMQMVLDRSDMDDPIRQNLERSYEIA